MDIATHVLACPTKHLVFPSPFEPVHAQVERPPGVIDRHHGNKKRPCPAPPCHSCRHDVHRPGSCHRVTPGPAIRAGHHASSSSASACASCARRRCRRCRAGDSVPSSGCHSGARHQVHGKKPGAQRQLGALIFCPADHRGLTVTAVPLAKATDERAAATVIATRIAEPFGPTPLEQGVVALCLAAEGWNELGKTETSLKLDSILGYRHLLVSMASSLFRRHWLTR